MPIYEYGCRSCRKRVSVFFRSIAAAASTAPTCPRCGSAELVRLVSRVALLRSEESRLDDLADPSSLGDLDENDPKSLAHWMRKMSNEVGEDLGDEMGEVIDRLEAGEDPESIERSMPELAGGDGDDWDGGGFDDEL